MFVPSLGGSLSSGDYQPEWRHLFGGGAYDSWGSAITDYFGVGSGPVVGDPDEGGIPDNTVAFVVPRDFSTLKITPVVKMNSGFTAETMVVIEAQSWTPNWSAGTLAPYNYWDSSYATGDFPVYSAGNTLNGCVTAWQAVYPNDWMDAPLGAGDLIVLYMWLSIVSPHPPQPLFMQGYLVEITG
jgi:hypothetical protein